MLLMSSADFFFFKLTFSENSFRNTIRVSNILDPDQGPNCLRRQNSLLAKKELIVLNTLPATDIVCPLLIKLASSLYQDQA